jgi:DNA-binding transcriptional LysR family regulator
MRTDLLTLKLFAAVYEELSIAKASDREHIALSALSKRLSDMEGAIGTSLFHRLRNGLEPTPAAEALIRHARLIMREVSQMETDLKDFTVGHKGQVRVWSNVWGIVQYLPEDLSGFLALHDKIHIDLHEDVSPAIIRAVEENAADIGIVAAEVPAPGLHLVPYRTDRLVVVLAADHPLAAQPSLRLSDMASDQIIRTRNKDTAIERLMSRFFVEAGDLLRSRISVSGFEAICRMAETKLGIGVVPEMTARRYMLNMKIAAVPLDEPWARRTLNICFADPATLPGAARLLIDHLKASSDSGQRGC